MVTVALKKSSNFDSKDAKPKKKATHLYLRSAIRSRFTNLR